MTSREARHSTDELTRVRMQADKLHAMLTDYREGIEPSHLYQVLYLTECERVMTLAPWVKEKLAAMRDEIASACGIDTSVR
jgi:hypothetical protein